MTPAESPNPLGVEFPVLVILSLLAACAAPDPCEDAQAASDSCASMAGLTLTYDCEGDDVDQCVADTLDVLACDDADGAAAELTRTCDACGCDSDGQNGSNDSGTSGGGSDTGYYY